MTRTRRIGTGRPRLIASVISLLVASALAVSDAGAATATPTVPQTRGVRRLHGHGRGPGQGPADHRPLGGCRSPRTARRPAAHPSVGRRLRLHDRVALLGRGQCAERLHLLLRDRRPLHGRCVHLVHRLRPDHDGRIHRRHQLPGRRLRRRPVLKPGRPAPRHDRRRRRDRHRDGPRRPERLPPRLHHGRPMRCGQRPERLRQLRRRRRRVRPDPDEHLRGARRQRRPPRRRQGHRNPLRPGRSVY